MLRIKRNESQSCLTVIAFSKNNILISGDLWLTPCSGNCKRTSYFNTMLPAVVVFFFLYGHYYYSYYYHFYETLLQLVSLFICSILALRSFLFPSLWKSALMIFLFLFYWFAWFLVSSSWYFAWLDLTLRLFLLFIYLPFFLCWLLWWY